MVKHAQTIRRLQPVNCLNVFDHFVGSAIERLTRSLPRGFQKQELLYI